MNTRIKIKRSLLELDNNTLQQSRIAFGEPLYVNNGTNEYLLLGKQSEGTDDTVIDDIPVINTKGVKLQPQTLLNSGVYYTDDDHGTLQNDCILLTNDDGNVIVPKTNAKSVIYEDGDITTVKDVLDDIVDGNASASRLKTQKGITAAGSDNYFILGVNDTSETFKDVYHANAYDGASQNISGIYFTGTGVLMGAAWNDYAEKRKCDTKEPGTCVVEVGDGTLKISDDYLLPGANIISDTYGMCIGEVGNPIAVSGRVLAYVEDKKCLKPGDALKTAPKGKLAKMTRREIRKYPDRIVGFVSEFPTYEQWNGVEVKDRIWVKVN